jgi:L-ribulose-5-phosphate 4-epimerase
MQYKELRREAFEANLEIPKQGLAIYTFGNVSSVDRNAGLFAIKPSGVAYEALTPESMVLVDLEGRIVEGKLNPSSDTPTHAVLYRAFATIGGICHTHSCHAVAWAQACREIPIYGTTHADHIAGSIPLTEVMADQAIRNDYEVETGHQITALFRDRNPDEFNMVLVACHGPFTWGATAAKAVYNARVLEELAHMAYLTEGLNSKIRPIKGTLIDKHYQRKHGKDAYYGQKKEH